MSGSDASVLPRGPVPGPVGSALAAVYGAVVARRNRRFDAGRGVVTLDRPVVSVGNLSVGGTGKTPMVGRIVRWMLEAGRRPCIAMRGYRAAAGESDEAAEYRRMFPDVPVVARPDRLTGLIQLFATEAGERVDAVVLDDGFQHRRIARQLDLVLIDASRDPFHDRLLPAGWLREPASSLRRAHAIALSHAEMAGPERIAALERAIAGAHGRPPVAVMRHAWTGLQRTRAGGTDGLPVEWLSGRRVLVVCAIGRPDAFVAQAARAAGREPAGRLILRDHDPYRRRTVRRIIDEARRAGAEAILTTEKDWSKLQRVPAEAWPCAVVRPVLELRFDRGGADLRAAVLAAVRAGAPPDPGE